MKLVQVIYIDKTCNEKVLFVPSTNMIQLDIMYRVSGGSYQSYTYKLKMIPEAGCSYRVDISFVDRISKVVVNADYYKEDWN